MGSFQHKQNWFAIALLCVVAFSSLFAVKEHVNDGQGPVTKQRYILKGLSIKKMTALVNRIDGEISHQLPIINAIGVNITPVQYQIIANNPGLRLSQNHTVISHGLRGHNYEYFPSHMSQTYINQQTDAHLLHQKGITGEKIGVAVIDSGLSAKYETGSHLRLNGQGENRIVAKYDAIGQQRSWELDDDLNGHGSHIAGVIASSVSDQNGRYNGIAPDVNLVSIRAFDSNGRGTYLDVIAGINWLVENNKRLGIRIANMSFGSTALSHPTDDPLNQAVSKAWDAGIIIVTSAGNRHPQPDHIQAPGNNPKVITVGAVAAASDAPMTSTSSAPFVDKPDIVSWNEQIVAQSAEGQYSEKRHQEAMDFGTSQAAAVVTGTVALMLQLEPKLTPDVVKCRLMLSARPVQDNSLNVHPVSHPAAKLSNAFDAVLSRATGCDDSQFYTGKLKSLTQRLSLTRLSVSNDKDNGLREFRGEAGIQGSELTLGKGDDRDDHEKQGRDWLDWPDNQGHLEDGD